MTLQNEALEQVEDRGEYIATLSGARFYLQEQNIEDIPIEDIAHALSMNCRFNGHTRDFYSVAEHCIHVSNLVSEKNALWGLLHDATEAFVPDMPRPFKKVIQGFSEYEDKIGRAIANWYGLVWPMPEEVHIIDQHIVAIEADALFPNKPDWTRYYNKELFEEWDGPIPLPPDLAEQFWLDRFNYLVKNR